MSEVTINADELRELQRKARCWDDMQSAKNVAASSPDETEWKRVARSGDVIPAIKLCRAAHGFSLYEAKCVVEAYRRGEKA